MAIIFVKFWCFLGKFRRTGEQKKIGGRATRNLARPFIRGGVIFLAYKLYFNNNVIPI